MQTVYAVIPTASASAGSRPCWPALAALVQCDAYFRVVAVENNTEKITKAYNKGIERCLETAGDNDIILCMHDDVILKDPGVLDRLRQAIHTADVIGAAGATEYHFSDFDCPNWMACGKHTLRGTVWHPAADRSEQGPYIPSVYGPHGTAVVIDGCFMAMEAGFLRRSGVRFDETLGRFYYDYAFSMDAAAKGARIEVLNTSILHLSHGAGAPTLTDGLRFQSPRDPACALDICIVTKHINTLASRCISTLLATLSDAGSPMPVTFYIYDTGSSAEEFDKFGKLEAFLRPCREVRDIRISSGPYHYARNNNALAAQGDARYLLFLNDDVAFTSEGGQPVLSALQLIRAARDVGTVGCLLKRTNGTIQHAGQTWARGQAGWKISHAVSYGMSGQAAEVQGNTGAFCMMRRSVFCAAGGFPETYEHCFEDVELNAVMHARLRLKSACVHSAWALHDESTTRKQTVSAADVHRIQMRLDELYYPPGLPN
jgi:GT2 family glycosyltransferase